MIMTGDINTIFLYFFADTQIRNANYTTPKQKKLVSFLIHSCNNVEMKVKEETDEENVLKKQAEKDKNTQKHHTERTTAKNGSHLAQVATGAISIASESSRL